MSLRRRFAQLASASALAQGIPMLAAPLLTRWYGAELLGQWALFAALAANLATVANARYEYAVILPRRDGEAGQLLRLCLWVALAVAAASALLAWALLRLPPQTGRWQALRGLDPWLWALPVAVGLAGIQQALTLWNNRRGGFAAIAQSRVIQQAATSLGQLGGALMWLPSAGQLVGAQLLGALLAPLWLQWRGVRWPSRPRPWRGRRAMLMWRLALRYRQFPLINSPHAFVNALQETAVLALITALQGPAAAGYYAVMVRLVKAPASLVGGALSEVLLGELARGWQRGEDLGPRLRRTLRGLALVSLLPLALLLLAGPQLFGWALGADWSVSGDYARWLAPYVAMHFITAPVTVTPMVTGRQTGALGFSVVGNAIYLLALAGVLLAGGRMSVALGAVSLCMPLYFWAYLAWLLRGARPAVALSA